MPPRNSQRERNHEIHEIHENWKYSNNSYGNNLIIYSRRLAGQANGDHGGPPTLVAGLSRFFRVFRVFRGSIFLFFHAPPLRGPAPARRLPGSKAIRRAHFRLGHRVPPRQGWAAGSDRFWLRELRVSQHFSTFYGPSVQAMETQLGARQRRWTRRSTEVVLHAPLAEPEAETPAAFWKKRQGSRKIRLSGKKTALGANRSRVAARFFVLHNDGHGPCPFASCPVAAGAGRPSPIAQPDDQTILRSDPVFPALNAAISMKTDDLREAYLEYFASRGCVRRPSDVLVPNDPTVLFTPAGMNQFKREFMGLGEPGFKRATTCQKCIRTGDIENVGKTPRHMTFFEMLGNFSFGDYFKREAIHWAWEFLTRVLKIAPDRLTFTVYLEDDEAFDIWHKEVGVAANRITRMGENDNFWPAGAPTHGPNGVCGPCSEIFYHGDGVEEVEIWNLVFTQFNRVGPGQLEPLPSKNIDTGMGLERAAAALQGVRSNFEIDVFKPIVAATAEALGIDYAKVQDSLNGVRIRRASDHVRALTFCIHENVRPGPEKQE